MPRRSQLAVAQLAVAVLAALLLAACGGASGSGSPSGGGTTAPTATTAASGTTATTVATSTTTHPGAGSVTATITSATGHVYHLTSGTVSCTTSPHTIVLNAKGTASGEKVTISAGVEGGYSGPGTYSFAQPGPMGSTSVGSVSGGIFGSGQLVIASGARSATVTAQYADSVAGQAGAQNVTGSVTASFSWTGCTAG